MGPKVVVQPKSLGIMSMKMNLIIEVRGARSVRDILEEMVLPGCFMMSVPKKGHYGLPRHFLNPKLPKELSFPYVMAAEWATQKIDRFTHDEL